MAGGELRRRWAVAGVGIPVGVGVIYLGGWVLAAVVGALAALGAREFYHLSRARGGSPFPWLGVPAAALFVLLAAGSSGFSSVAIEAWALILVLTLTTLAAAVWLRGPEGDPLTAVGGTVVGSIYVGGTLSFAVLLRQFPGPGGEVPAAWEGSVLLLFPLAVTWAADSAAYFAGRRWGRAKLLPRVSPKKTVVGGVAALVGGVAAAAVFGHLFMADSTLVRVGPVAVLVMGLAIAAVAQVGDLAESVLKRAAGVKDSGSLIPGHGGVLDRFDSLFAVLPLTYALLSLAGRGG